MPKSKSSRSEKDKGEDKDRKRSSRSERGDSRDRKSSGRDRSRSEERSSKSDRKSKDRVKRRSTDGEVGAASSYYNTERAGNDGLPNAQPGAGFSQFPGQYDAMIPGGPPGGPAARPSGSVPLSNHVPDMFPGQFPTDSAAPYRPPFSANEGGHGLAAEYYGDQGQSVQHQPGVRPDEPSLIIGHDPHLMSALPVAAPPIEPSATGSTGAAASFYTGQSFVSPSTSPQPSKPSKPSKPGRKPSRPSEPLSAVSPLDTGGMGFGLGAAAAGAAAGYFMNQHSSSNHQNSYTSTQLQTNSAGKPHQQSYSSDMKPPRPDHSPRHSPSSFGPGAAAAAGVAGVAAAAYGHHHHEHNHDEYYGNGGYNSSDMMQHRRRRGPMSRFVDFFRDPEGVARYEEYSEYVGVCRYCFEPGSSPRDAPRKHHYHRRRSFEKNGSSTRVDKTGRYYAAEENKRRNKSWVASAATGIGLAAAGKAIFGNNRDFDDTYSVYSGKPGASSSSIQVNRRYSSDDDRKSITKRGTLGLTEADLKKVRVDSFDRDGKSKHSEKERKTRSKESKSGFGVTEGLIGATVAAAAIGSEVAKRSSSPKEVRVRRKSRSSSPSDRGTGRRKLRRASPQRKESPGFFAGLFGSPASDDRKSRRSKKGGGFFSMSNGSSSSVSSRRGTESDRTRRRRSSNKIKSTEDAKAAVIDLGIAASALAAADRGSSGSRRGRVVAVKESKGKDKYGRRGEREGRRRHEKADSAGEWEDASDDEEHIDYGLAYDSNGSQVSLSNTTGTQKWDWRWRKASPSPRRSSFGNGLATAATVGAAGAAVGAVLEHKERDRRDKRDNERYYEPGSKAPERPIPVPLQQPQPIAPISSTVYRVEDSYDARNGVKYDDSTYRYDSASKTNGYSDSKSERNLRRASEPRIVNVSPKPKYKADESSTVRFNFTEEQERRHQELDDAAGEQKSKRGSESRDSEKKRRRRRESSDDYETRSARDEDRSSREEKRSSKDKSSWAEPALAGVAAAAIGATVVSELSKSDEKKQRRRDERDRERDQERDQERDRDRERERERERERDRDRDRERDRDQRNQPKTESVEYDSRRKERKPSGWDSVVGAAAGAAAGAEVARRSKSSKSRSNDDDQYSELSDEARERLIEDRNKIIARRAANLVKRAPSPAHEDYASYFVPDDILSKPAQGKEKAHKGFDKDAVDMANIVTIEPKDSKDGHKELILAGLEKFDDPLVNLALLDLPWRVPPLRLINPTPPPPIDTKLGGLSYVSAQDKPREITREVQKAEDAEEVVVVSDKGTSKGSSSSKKAKKAEPINADREEVADKSSRKKKSRTPKEEPVETEPPVEEVTSRHVPGAFGDDIEFAATLAAGLEDSGFDPNIVVEDPQYRRRDSPPGSNATAFYQQPFYETVSDIGAGRTGSEPPGRQHGWVEDEELPATPKDEDPKTNFESKDAEQTSQSSRKKKKNKKTSSLSQVTSVDETKEGEARGMDSLGADNSDAELEIIEAASRAGSEDEKFVSAADVTQKESDKSSYTNGDGAHRSNGTREIEESKDEVFESPAEDFDGADSAVSAPAGGEEGRSRKSKKKKRRSIRDDDNMSVVSSPAKIDETRRRRSVRDDDDNISVISTTSRADDKKRSSSSGKKIGGLFGIFSRAVDDASDNRRAREEFGIPPDRDTDDKKGKSKSDKSKDVEEDRDSSRKSRRSKDGDEEQESSRKSRRSKSTDDDKESSSKSRRSKSIDDDKESVRSSSKKEKRRSRQSNADEDEEAGRRSRDLPSKVLQSDFGLASQDNDSLTLEKAQVIDPSELTLQDGTPGSSRSRSTKDEQDEPSFLGERPRPTKPPDIGEGWLEESRGRGLESINRGFHTRSGSSQPSIVSTVSEPAFSTPEQPRRLSMVSPGSTYILPTASPTAVPLHFRRRPSAVLAVSGARSSSATPLGSPSTPKSRKARPQSTEFNSKEFRPLFLVEAQHAKVASATSAEDEAFPSLPSSHSNSRSSSVHEDSSEGEQPVVGRAEHERDSSLSALEVTPKSKFKGGPIDLSAAGDLHADDLLGSQQVTPTAESFEADRRLKRERDALEQAMQENVTREAEWKQRYSSDSGRSKRSSGESQHSSGQGRNDAAIAMALGAAALAGGGAAYAISRKHDQEDSEYHHEPMSTKEIADPDIASDGTQRSVPVLLPPLSYEPDVASEDSKKRVEESVFPQRRLSKGMSDDEVAATMATIATSDSPALEHAKSADIGGLPFPEHSEDISDDRQPTSGDRDTIDQPQSQDAGSFGTAAEVVTEVQHHLLNRDNGHPVQGAEPFEPLSENETNESTLGDQRESSTALAETVDTQQDDRSLQSEDIHGTEMSRDLEKSDIATEPLPESPAPEGILKRKGSKKKNDKEKRRSVTFDLPDELPSFENPENQPAESEKIGSTSQEGEPAIYAEPDQMSVTESNDFGQHDESESSRDLANNEDIKPDMPGIWPEPTLSVEIPHPNGDGQIEASDSKETEPEDVEWGSPLSPRRKKKKQRQQQQRQDSQDDESPAVQISEERAESAPFDDGTSQGDQTNAALREFPSDPAEEGPFESTWETSSAKKPKKKGKKKGKAQEIDDDDWSSKSADVKDLPMEEAAIVAAEMTEEPVEASSQSSSTIVPMEAAEEPSDIGWDSFSSKKDKKKGKKRGIAQDVSDLPALESEVNKDMPEDDEAAAPKTTDEPPIETSWESSSIKKNKKKKGKKQATRDEDDWSTPGPESQEGTDRAAADLTDITSEAPSEPDWESPSSNKKGKKRKGKKQDADEEEVDASVDAVAEIRGTESEDVLPTVTEPALHEETESLWESSTKKSKKKKGNRSNKQEADDWSISEPEAAPLQVASALTRSIENPPVEVEEDKLSGERDSENLESGRDLPSFEEKDLPSENAEVAGKGDIKTDSKPADPQLETEFEADDSAWSTSSVKKDRKKKGKKGASASQGDDEWFAATSRGAEEPLADNDEDKPLAEATIQDDQSSWGSTSRKKDKKKKGKKNSQSWDDEPEATSLRSMDDEPTVATEAAEPLQGLEETTTSAKPEDTSEPLAEVAEAAEADPVAIVAPAQAKPKDDVSELDWEKSSSKKMNVGTTEETQSQNPEDWDIPASNVDGSTAQEALAPEDGTRSSFGNNENAQDNIEQLEADMVGGLHIPGYSMMNKKEKKKAKAKAEAAAAASAVIAEGVLDEAAPEHESRDGPSIPEHDYNDKNESEQLEADMVDGLHIPGYSMMNKKEKKKALTKAMAKAEAEAEAETSAAVAIDEFHEAEAEPESVGAQAISRSNDHIEEQSEQLEADIVDGLHVPGYSMMNKKEKKKALIKAMAKAEAEAEAAEAIDEFHEAEAEPESVDTQAISRGSDHIEEQSEQLEVDMVDGLHIPGYSMMNKKEKKKAVTKAMAKAEAEAEAAASAAESVDEFHEAEAEPESVDAQAISSSSDHPEDQREQLEVDMVDGLHIPGYSMMNKKEKKKALAKAMAKAEAGAGPEAEAEAETSTPVAIDEFHEAEAEPESVDTQAISRSSDYTQDQSEQLEVDMVDGLHIPGYSMMNKKDKKKAKAKAEVEAEASAAISGNEFDMTQAEPEISNPELNFENEESAQDQGERLEVDMVDGLYIPGYSMMSKKDKKKAKAKAVTESLAEAAAATNEYDEADADPESLNAESMLENNENAQDQDERLEADMVDGLHIPGYSMMNKKDKKKAKAKAEAQAEAEAAIATTGELEEAKSEPEAIDPEPISDREESTQRQGEPLEADMVDGLHIPGYAMMSKKEKKKAKAKAEAEAAAEGAVVATDELSEAKSEPDGFHARSLSDNDENFWDQTEQLEADMVDGIHIPGYSMMNKKDKKKAKAKAEAQAAASTSFAADEPAEDEAVVGYEGLDTQAQGEQLEADMVDGLYIPGYAMMNKKDKKKAKAKAEAEAAASTAVTANEFEEDATEAEQLRLNDQEISESYADVQDQSEQLEADMVDGIYIPGYAMMSKKDKKKAKAKAEAEAAASAALASDELDEPAAGAGSQDLDDQVISGNEEHAEDQSKQLEVDMVDGLHIPGYAMMNKKEKKKAKARAEAEAAASTAFAAKDLEEAAAEAEHKSLAYQALPEDGESTQDRSEQLEADMVDGIHIPGYAMMNKKQKKQAKTAAMAEAAAKAAVAATLLHAEVEPTSELKSDPRDAGAEYGSDVPDSKDSQDQPAEADDLFEDVNEAPHTDPTWEDAREEATFLSQKEGVDQFVQHEPHSEKHSDELAENSNQEHIEVAAAAEASGNELESQAIEDELDFGKPLTKAQLKKQKKLKQQKARLSTDDLDSSTMEIDEKDMRAEIDKRGELSIDAGTQSIEAKEGSSIEQSGRTFSDDPTDTFATADDSVPQATRTDDVASPLVSDNKILAASKPEADLDAEVPQPQRKGSKKGKNKKKFLDWEDAAEEPLPTDTSAKGEVSKAVAEPIVQPSQNPGVAESSETAIPADIVDKSDQSPDLSLSKDETELLVSKPEDEEAVFDTIAPKRRGGKQKKSHGSSWDEETSQPSMTAETPDLAPHPSEDASQATTQNQTDFEMAVPSRRGSKKKKGKKAYETWGDDIEKSGDEARDRTVSIQPVFDESNGKKAADGDWAESLAEQPVTDKAFADDDKILEGSAEEFQDQDWSAASSSGKKKNKKGRKQSKVLAMADMFDKQEEGLQARSIPGEDKPISTERADAIVDDQQQAHNAPESDEMIESELTSANLAFGDEPRDIFEEPFQQEDMFYAKPTNEGVASYEIESSSRPSRKLSKAEAKRQKRLSSLDEPVTVQDSTPSDSLDAARNIVNEPQPFEDEAESWPVKESKKKKKRKSKSADPGPDDFDELESSGQGYKDFLDGGRESAAESSAIAKESTDTVDGDGTLEVLQATDAQQGADEDFSLSSKDRKSKKKRKSAQARTDDFEEQTTEETSEGKRGFSPYSRTPAALEGTASESLDRAEVEDGMTTSLGDEEAFIRQSSPDQRVDEHWKSEELADDAWAFSSASQKKKKKSKKKPDPYGTDILPSAEQNNAEPRPALDVTAVDEDEAWVEAERRALADLPPDEAAASQLDAEAHVDINRADQQQLEERSSRKTKSKRRSKAGTEDQADDIEMPNTMDRSYDETEGGVPSFMDDRDKSWISEEEVQGPRKSREHSVDPAIGATAAAVAAATVATGLHRSATVKKSKKGKAKGRSSQRQETEEPEDQNTNAEALRDSAVYLEAPDSPPMQRSVQSIRDSGYQGSPLMSKYGELESTNSQDIEGGYDNTFESGFQHGNRRQSSPFDDVELPVHRSIEAQDSKDSDRRTSHSTSRDASPVQPTTRDRASTTLFSSSPSTREAPRHDHRTIRNIAQTFTPERGITEARSDSAHPEEARKSLFGDRSVADDDDFTGLSSPPQTPAAFEGTPLATITESSPEDVHVSKHNREITDIGEPEHGVKASRKSTLSPQPRRHYSQRAHSPLNPENPRSLGHISTEDLIARQEWPEVDEDAIPLDRSKSRGSTRSHALSSPSPDLHRPRRPPSLPLDAIARDRRSASGESMRSGDSISAYIRPSPEPQHAGHHSLRRRSDRSLSSDLREARRLSQASDASLRKERLDLGGAKTEGARSNEEENIVASSSTYDPTKDKGKSRITKMADVYEAWGDAQGSPRSPTRPPSMRRRQSLQILDLETRLDQLVSENRLLQDAKARAERGLDEAQGDHSQQSTAMQEAVRTRDIYLQQKDEELDHLRETLEGLQQQVSELTAANAGLVATHAARSLDSGFEEKYRQLQDEHRIALEEREGHQRELESLRTKHTSLSGGMEGIIRQEVNAAIASKDAELLAVRDELEAAQEQIRNLKQQILEARNSGGDEDLVVERDEDYFEAQCQKLCQHIQTWVLRFSKYSDSKICRSVKEINDEVIRDRFEDVMLDGSDVDIFLRDRVRRRDVFMAVVMGMVQQYVFMRYLFGMDREQRNKLKALEKHLSEVGSDAAVNRWRATTLTLLTRRPAFAQQRQADVAELVEDVYTTLAKVLNPPSDKRQAARDGLVKVMGIAADLSIEMRTQRARYVMLPPLAPEYDADGELARTIPFNASMMNERSGRYNSNEELQADGAAVRLMLFPLVVRRDGDEGDGDEGEDIIVCPAQVLVTGENDEDPRQGRSGGKKAVRVVSTTSLGTTATGAVTEGGMF